MAGSAFGAFHGDHRRREKKGREVALRFEQMRGVFGQLLARKKLNMPVPLTIFAIKDDKRFYQIGPVA